MYCVIGLVNPMLLPTPHSQLFAAYLSLKKEQVLESPTLCGWWATSCIGLVNVFLFLEMG